MSRCDLSFASARRLQIDKTTAGPHSGKNGCQVKTVARKFPLIVGNDKVTDVPKEMFNFAQLMRDLKVKH